VCAPWKRCVRTVSALWTRCSNCLHAVEASWTLWRRRCRTACGRYRDAVRTLCTRYTWQILYLYAYFAATLQRADRFLERCTTVTSPFGVTRALGNFSMSFFKCLAIIPHTATCMFYFYVNLLRVLQVKSTWFTFGFARLFIIKLMKGKYLLLKIGNMLSFDIKVSVSPTY